MLHIRLIIIGFFILLITDLSYASNAYDNCLCSDTWIGSPIDGGGWTGNNDNGIYGGDHDIVCTDNVHRSKTTELITGTAEYQTFYHTFSHVQECQVCTDPDIPADTPEDNSTHYYQEIAFINCTDSSLPPFDYDFKSIGVTKCCAYSVYYKLNKIDPDNNTTDPDNNTTDPNSPCEPPLVESSISAGSCVPDSDGDGEGDDTDDTPFGEGSGCPANSHHSSADMELCDCNNGYHHENILTNTGSCIKDEDAEPLRCPAVDISGIPLAFETTSEQGCYQNILENNRKGGNGGSVNQLDINVNLFCCYFHKAEPTETNNTSNPNDPCDYPLTKDGKPLKNLTGWRSICEDDINLFGGGTGSYEKNPDCNLGACYYSNTDNNNPDNNSTNNSNNNNNNDTDNNNTHGNISSPDANGTQIIDMSPLTNILNKLNKSVNNQGNRLANRASTISADIKNNTKVLGTKLDDIEKAIKDKNISLEIDLNETNDILRDINASLNPLVRSDDLKPYHDAEDNAKRIFDDALSSFASTGFDIRALSSGLTPPSISTSGDCTITRQLSFGSFTIDLSPVSILRPYVQFFLNLVLFIFSWKLYSAIARDIMTYFSSGW